MRVFIIALTMAITVALSANTASADSVKARLVIDIGPLGVHSWILKGIQDGAFARRGVDVQFIGKGPGSVKNSLAITAGKAELGYHDYSGVVLVNSKQDNPKVVISIDHPNYGHAATLAKATLAELKRDLAL